MTFAPSFARPLTRLGLLLAVACGTAALPAAAADEEAPPSLEEEQRAVAAQFARLEDTLLKMARYLRKTEPERSELLVRALQKAREERIEVRMKEVSDLLRSDAAAGLAPNFGDAIDRQAELVDGMRNVLALLRSEDRRKEIDSEQERLAALLKDVNRLMSDEKAAEAANRRGDSASRVAGKQRDVLDRTDDLLKEVKGADADKAAGEAGEPTPAGPRGDPSEGAPGEPKEPGAEGDPTEDMKGGEPGEPGEPSDGIPSETKPGEGEPGAPKPNGGEPGENEKAPGETEPKEPGKGAEPGEPSQSPPGEPSESGESSPSEPKPGQPGQPGQPGESGEQPPSESQPQEPKESTPGREELEQAKKAMEDALKELEQAEREGAQEKQAEAIKKLAEAKEKLEEILRQLREEEAELVLRALEVRFQKMLTMQQAVLTDTVSLASVGEITDRERAKARDLARREREIGLEGAKALLLLREDGSSVAFPEALEQIAADVDFAAGLLSQEPPRTDELTQQVERDIIESLEELIDALQQELEKLQQEKQEGQSQQGEPMQPGEEALVDKISELKMLRTLQKGVNRRTRLLGLEVPAPGDPADVDVVARLRELSKRQSRIESATYDLAVGKTN
ncbi:hypothetical protein [Alienimonas californiensis]|uniref:Uncharacterized protein n=1 Tax=Alienimonas californiensis TaxID=2527989 RepID=A0A517PD63_9PLAN|nr:hypothetical protein [Alienimonas californiensis]QDT17310.1 hypothetical protein CA12_34300 [Alienimonas californiensis]